MSEQTFFLAIIIGLLGASCSLGLAVGARDAGERLRQTEVKINIADMVRVEITNGR